MRIFIPMSKPSNGCSGKTAFFITNLLLLLVFIRRTTIVSQRNGPEVIHPGHVTH